MSAHVSPPRGTASVAPTDSSSALPRWQKPRSLFLLAIWCGLASGSIEALAIYFCYVKHIAVLDMVSQFVWTIPLTDALVLLVPGFFFWLWASWFGLNQRRFGIVVFCFTSFCAGLVIVSVTTIFVARLRIWALALLAIGVGVQCARTAAKRPRFVYGLMKVTSPIMAAAALLVGGYIQYHFVKIEHDMIASMPAPTPGAPNVLFIVLDTVRAKSLGLYGYNRHTTANLQRWARNAAVFDQAVSSAPYTLTSHSAMFTGIYPMDLKATWTVPLEENLPTLAQVLHDHGYLTMGAVANTWNAGRQSGLDRGFAHFEGAHFTVPELMERSALCRAIHDQRIPARAEQINREFLNWITHNDYRPYFAFLNYNDCHAVYDPVTPYDHPEEPMPFLQRMTMVRWCLESFKAPSPETDPAKLQKGLDDYDQCIKELDRDLGSLLGDLKANGDLDNTIVVIVGDHGEQFGEHNLVQHADSLYRAALHVPLIIVAPHNASAGAHIHQMVTLRDLPATILDLLNIKDSGIPGDSFAAAMRDGPMAPLPDKPKFAYIDKGVRFPDWHPNAKGVVRAVFFDGMEYIKNPSHSNRDDEMYNFETDLNEQHNLADDPAHKKIADQCRQLLDEHAPHAEPQIAQAGTGDSKTQ